VRPKGSEKYSTHLTSQEGHPQRARRQTSKAQRRKADGLSCFSSLAARWNVETCSPQAGVLIVATQFPVRRSLQWLGDSSARNVKVSAKNPARSHSIGTPGKWSGRTWHVAMALLVLTQRGSEVWDSNDAGSNGAEVQRFVRQQAAALLNDVRGGVSGRPWWWVWANRQSVEAASGASPWIIDPETKAVGPVGELEVRSGLQASRKPVGVKQRRRADPVSPPVRRTGQPFRSQALQGLSPKPPGRPKQAPGHID